MKEKNINIIVGVAFAILLVGTGITQTHLKNMPQIFMLLFGVFTLFSFVIKQKLISTILFYSIIGTMLYINFFILTNFVIDLINLNRGWVEFEGNRYKVMDMTWIWGAIIGFVFSPITLILYHRIKRSRVMEIGVSIVFLVITAIILLIKNL